MCRQCHITENINRLSFGTAVTLRMENTKRGKNNNVPIGAKKHSILIYHDYTVRVRKYFKLHYDRVNNQTEGLTTSNYMDAFNEITTTG